MALKQLPEDFREFLSFLNEHNVRYLLLGGWAVGIYGYPRATADMDVLIAIDQGNLDSLRRALLRFGAPEPDLEQFKIIGNVFRMGRSPLRIEIINEASGIDFEDCFPRRQLIELDGITVSLIAKTDLIQNKRASGRRKDLADIESLEEIDDRESELK